MPIQLPPERLPSNPQAGHDGPQLLESWVRHPTLDTRIVRPVHIGDRRHAFLGWPSVVALP
jgi:hypothetical protein